MQATRFITLAALGAVLGSAPAEAHSRHARGSDRGIVEVQNRAGVPLTVSVEGGVRTIDPFETERFVVRTGAAAVRATYEMYGERFTLFAQTVRVGSRGVTHVDATPAEVAQLRLINASGAETEFVLDGREIAELRAGESRIVSVPLGSAELRAFARGVQLESDRVFLRPFEETTLVAEPPAFAQLVVDNPLPIAVEVEVGHSERRVEAFGRTVFERVPVGTVQVETRRLGGELLDCERVQVYAWSGAHLTVESPSTGLVRLASEDDDVLRVYADGRLVATLGAFATVTVPLPVGNMALEMRTLDGRLVDREYVYVNAFAMPVVDFGQTERHHGHHARGDSHDDRRDGEHEMARR